MTHYFSQLAARAAQEMADIAPTSYQAHELEAESLESQQNWDAAGNEYRKILEQNPNLPGIHYRLGRVALSKTESAANTEEARKEFEAELKIDASNAAATERWSSTASRRPSNSTSMNDSVAAEIGRNSGSVGMVVIQGLCRMICSGS